MSDYTHDECPKCRGKRWYRTKRAGGKGRCAHPELWRPCPMCNPEGAIPPPWEREQENENG